MKPLNNGNFACGNIKDQMRLRISNKTNPRQTGQVWSGHPPRMEEPCRTAQTHKNRWLVATGLTGLLGIGALSGVLLLSPEPQDHSLMTKPLAKTGTPLTAAQNPRRTPLKTAEISAKSSAKASVTGLRKSTDPVSGDGKQAMLKIPQGPGVGNTTSRLGTKPALSIRLTDHSGEPSITGTGKLATANRSPSDLAASASLKPQSHGDLISALKQTAPSPATTSRAKSAGPRRPAGGRLPPASGPSGETEDVRLIVGRGDTLYGLLTDKGISPQDATSIIRELRPVFSPRNLKKGHILAMTLRRDPATGTTRPQRMEIKTASATGYIVEMNKNGEYERVGKTAAITGIARLTPPAGRKKSPLYNRARAQIQSSFYQSALAQNLPPAIVNKMTGILSYDVDFQREVNRGDVFEVLYSDKQSGGKSVLYAELVTNRKKHAFYRFKSPDGMINYYNKDGESAQKTFMRTPINGARITSRFGRRKHPILGYTKMHTGIDFGVARGTPIYAAAAGKIQKAGWAGGYGKYVRIQHSKKLTTAYAHMSRIARGIRPGRTISQGQIIGYVGSTGRSTGPHLHYEIRVSGKLVNPMRYKLANKTKKLRRQWLALFKKEKSRIDRLRKQVPVATNVASISN